jgi:hypothetical protein
MGSDVAKFPRSTDVQQPATNTLPTAVEQVMAGLQQAIAEMRADDISITLTASQETNRSTAHFSLRAYRKGQKILDEDNNV